MKGENKSVFYITPVVGIGRGDCSYIESNNELNIFTRVPNSELSLLFIPPGRPVGCASPQRMTMLAPLGSGPAAVKEPPSGSTSCVCSAGSTRSRKARARPKWPVRSATQSTSLSFLN